MPKQSLITDREILEAALVGFTSRLDETNSAIAGIRSRLGIRGPRPLVMSTDGMQPTKRRMSAAARRRIALAQKKRWVAARAEKAEAEKPVEKPKRKLSRAGRAAIVAATKKRWAAVRKEQKAAEKKKAPVAKKAAPKKTTKPAVKAPATTAAPLTS